MAGLYPLSRMQQTDANGDLLSGARLFIFDGGTSTPRTGYRDLALTTEHPNPIVADASGRLPLIYLDDGYYRQRLTTSTGTLIFDDDGIPVLTTSAGGAGTSVDPDSVFKTRDIKIRFDDQALAGYVRMNGRTIGSAASGATERANADTQSLYEELWQFANITVAAGKGASAAADFAANKALTLPDMAGRLIAGMDTMGGAAAGRITTAVLGADPSAPGAVGGAQTLTIAASNLPTSSPWLATASTSVSGSTASDGAHTHTGVTEVTPQDHLHESATAANKSAAIVYSSGGLGLANIWNGGDTVQNTSGQLSNHAHTFSTSQNGAHTHTLTLSGTTTVTMQSNSGGGQAANKLPPLMTLMIFIRL